MITLCSRERTQQRTRQAQAHAAGLTAQMQHLDREACALKRELDQQAASRNEAVAQWCAERAQLRQHADEWQRALHLEQARAQRLELRSLQTQQVRDSTARQEQEVILAAVAGAVGHAQSRKDAQARFTRLHLRIEQVERALRTAQAELETCRAEREALRQQITTNTARHETDVAFIRFQAESEMTSLADTHEKQLAQMEAQLKSANEQLKSANEQLNPPMSN